MGRPAQQRKTRLSPAAAFCLIAAMPRLTYAAFALAAAFLGSCSTMTNARSDNDPYLWLEEVEGERALAWVREQNAQSLAQLESDPRFAALRADAQAILTSQDRLALGAVREGYLYNFWQDATHVRGVWRRSPLADYAANKPRWDTILDIDALAAAENQNWVFKGVDCMEGTTRCMVSLSDGGKDAVIWREYDIATRAFVAGGFALPEAKSQIAWSDADTLLVATDWGDGTMTESGYPYIVKRWRRGQPLETAAEIMRGAVSDVGVFAGVLQDVDGRRAPMASQAVTFFETVSFLLPENGPPQRLNLPGKSTVQGLFNGQLLVTLQEAWTPQDGAAPLPNGALVSVALDSAATSSPRVALLSAPGSRESIEDIAITHDAVLVAGYSNVRGRIQRFAFNNGAWTQTQIDLPPNGSVGFAGASPTQSQAFAVFQDFLTPSTLYALDNQVTQARAVRSLPAQFDASRFAVEQFEATSRDGAQIPYFVVRQRDMALNGRNPTLLYAYGGFQVSMLPTYAANVGKLWLERGGVYVLANIRGGGEFGPAWHQAGLRTNRQRIYDDFYAIERDLVDRNITSPRRLGIEGGSNGGLLMGVMLNQHPEMVRAAIVQVPLLDMLRYDQLLAGASWVDEYGSPADPVERAFLETISPYQNLRPRADFPTPFVLTSTKDDRVHPGHARKYVARLRELGLPVLYYENIDGGHSAAANLNETARRLALEYTYLAQQLMD
jgi:prolyl oligopeptidase